MARHSTARNTAGMALMAPESTASHRLGTYYTLTEAFKCVRSAIKNRGIKAVGITSMLHIGMKLPPDSRPLIADDSFDKFEHWFGPLYQFFDHFEVRMEEVPEVSDHTSSVHPRMAIILCLKKEEELKNITDIKEQ